MRIEVWLVVRILWDEVLLYVVGEVGGDGKKGENVYVDIGYWFVEVVVRDFEGGGMVGGEEY